ncbi:MAG: BamA/TamA family outer membrane protein [Candidatus Omnitrophota bacterium]
MKTDVSVSTSGIGNGIKSIGRRWACGWILFLAAVSFLRSAPLTPDFKGYTVDNIFLKFYNRIEIAPKTRFNLLLRMRPGDRYNYKNIRSSIENLYKTGIFENIEVQVQDHPGNRLDVFFIITDKYNISAIKFVGVKKKGSSPYAMIPAPIQSLGKKELTDSIYSLRKNTYFEENKMEDAVKEVTDFLHSRGFFAPEITYDIIKNPAHSTVEIRFYLALGMRAVIAHTDLKLIGNRQDLLPKIRKRLDTFFYIPYKFKEKTDKVIEFLKKENYYLPEVTVTENFLDAEKSKVNLQITVDPGYKYIIIFEGMKPKLSLIDSIWKKKVFEKWAEKESKSRILYELKNQGYLDAKVSSRIKNNRSKREKTITFTVTKNQKYKLGDVHLQGNQSVPDAKLLSIMQSNTIEYDRFFHARLRTLLVDREILRLFYYFQGFPSAEISTIPQFNDHTADVLFTIKEGKKFTVASLQFEGNRFFSREALLSHMKTVQGQPFVQQQLNEDIEQIKTLYITSGFEKVDITPEISKEIDKQIVIKIKEGKAYRMGDIVIIGGSSSQQDLIKRLFPFKKDAPFDQTKLEDFQREIENSSIFNNFNIVKIEEEPDYYDLLIRVNPDYSTYYGFGIGWEGRKSLRGTVEYQGRNVFRSYSNFSVMAQVGPREQSGVLSFDTPYFLMKRMNSAFKIWADNDIYPSYEFYRYGVGESLVRKITPNSYIMGSLSFYRTKLTKLLVSQSGIDAVDVPFNTTALDLSYVNELRDDPFNPTQGTHFSTDLKIGFPVFQKNYSFIRSRLNYQMNFKFFKTGVFSASARTGIALGEMSITERFFAGGYNSFRAVGKDRLGPIDMTTDHPLGGNALLLLNFEAMFPMAFIPINNLYYAIFADVGNVFDRVRHFNLLNLRTGVGLSLKYKTQMGPLRFDVAWDTKTGKPEFQIGIGNVF